MVAFGAATASPFRASIAEPSATAINSIRSMFATFHRSLGDSASLAIVIWKMVGEPISLGGTYCR